MSMGIVMALVMNLIPLLFSLAFVHSDQSTVPLRAFMIRGNVTYECIDIYKQPGLDNPLLKNHTIQIKPSASRSELKNLTGNNIAHKKKIRCPFGTVPVLINTKKTQPFAEKYFHPLSTRNPGTHFAGVSVQNGPYHGVGASFDGYALNVERGQASYGHIYIHSRLNNELNFISTGWMINPALFGDGRVWSYIFWKGKNGKRCYNTGCPGFVQVSQEVPVSGSVDLQPGERGLLHCAIHQDKQTGNWWLTKLKKNAPNIDVGYWPKELFDLLDNGADTLGVGGVVHASTSGLSPPMGNGKYPNEDYTESSSFINIEILNSDYEYKRMDSSPIEKNLDSPNCYGLRIGVPSFQVRQLGFFINYGGPGGNSCGI